MKSTIDIDGMTCSHCETKVSLALGRLDGIKKVKANAARGRVVVVHERQLDLDEVAITLEANGYSLATPTRFKGLKSLGLISFLTLTGYLTLRFSGTLDFGFLPEIRQNMSYGALFVVGLLTSVHCVAMCGGINVSQGVKKGYSNPTYPSLLYNCGRLTSYTIMGGIIGGIGTILRFSGQFQGYVIIAVSAIMILMALKLLKVFQFDLSLLKYPRFLVRTKRKLDTGSPYFVGLLNGLMACGPLQSMHLYALGTGSVVVGALSMFYFCLGTFPLMFGLGLFSFLLENRFSKQIARISALIIFVLSLTMLNRGIALAGIVMPYQINLDAAKAVMVGENLQTVRIELDSNTYGAIEVKRGVPVNFIIAAKAQNLNGCNNPMIIPALGIEKTLVPGDNEINFTIDSPGLITYSCWMGMITSSIRVVA